MKPFRIQAIDGSDHVTVRIAGEVDLACAEYLAEAFGQALATERDIVVDCSQITFIDGTGLTALAEARDVAHKCHLDFQLASVPAQVRRVLELADAAALFNIAQEPAQSEPSISRATTPDAREGRGGSRAAAGGAAAGR